MLRLDFTTRRGDFTLSVRADLPERGITGVFGRSGAGKSTLIDTIAGLTRPERGQVVLGERSFVDIERGLWTPIEQRRVGYVFQDAKLFPHLRVLANLRYGAKRVQDSRRDPDWARVLEVMDLGHLLQRWPNSLSGGERQRVAIARALLAQPELMLMDEPLASLDAPRKAEILHYIERLRDEYPMPVLFVSHSVDEMVRVADHLLLLSEGRVVACGPFLEMVADTGLQPHLGRFEGLLNDGRATVVVAAKGYERLERTLPKYRELTVTEVLTLEKSPERAPPPRRPATPERRPEPREEAPPPREEVPQEDGFLKLLAKPPARASVRGRDLGWTPVLKHALPPGTYTVELVRDEEPAYRASLQVQIKPGETTFERYTHP